MSLLFPDPGTFWTCLNINRSEMEGRLAIRDSTGRSEGWYLEFRKHGSTVPEPLGSCFKTDQTTLLTFADYIVSLCVFADPNFENQIKVTIQSDWIYISRSIDLSSKIMGELSPRSRSSATSGAMRIWTCNVWLCTMASAFGDAGPVFDCEWWMEFPTF